MTANSYLNRYCLKWVADCCMNWYSLNWFWCPDGRNLVDVRLGTLAPANHCHA